jgi:uncharacterized sulfatase
LVESLIIAFLQGTFFFMKQLFILSSLLVCFTALSQKQYHVVFIAVDDLGISMSTYGNTEIPTPNISRLAQRGVLFNQAYCQYGLCSPSRTSLLSGRRPDATGITDNKTEIRANMSPDYKFLPEYFDFFGYRTENYGKVGPCEHEREIAWDYYYDNNGFAYSAPANAPYWCIDTVHENETETRPGLSTTALIARLQQGFSEPSFLGLGLSTHAPFTPTLDAWNELGDSTMTELIPVDIYGTLGSVVGNGSGNISLPSTPIDDSLDIPAPARKPPLFYSDEETQRIRHAFFAEIIQTDQQVGRLLDAMDSLHLWDSTIVVFWGDHGLHMGEHDGQWLKLTLFEESLRVPFVICAPGFGSGVCNRPVELVDIFPTLTELCNLPKPDSLEGSSLVPLLEKPDAVWKRAIFAQLEKKREFNITGRAVRTERYHYNFWPTYGEELYDIMLDPFEYHNLVDDSASQNILNEMRTIQSEGWELSLPPAYSKSTYYKDQDEDGFGVSSDTLARYFQPAGYAAVANDCDDTNSLINPTVADANCNGIDDNCNGIIDDGKPVPVISKRGNVDICLTDSVLLRTNKNNSFTYQWYKDGAIISGATSFYFVAKEAGSYTVIVTARGCSSESLPTVVTNSCGFITQFKPNHVSEEANNIPSRIDNILTNCCY